MQKIKIVDIRRKSVSRKEDFNRKEDLKQPKSAFLILTLLLAGALSAVLFFNHAVLANEEGAIITGYKFYDINGIEGRNEDEPGIDDWGIKLFMPNEEGGFDEVDSTDTHDGGYYYFSGELDDGTYILCERKGGENWSQTYPTQDTPGAVSCHGLGGELDGELEQWGWGVEIKDGGVIGDIESFDFGNTIKLGAISVVKFNDRNGDGVRDEGELGIEGIEFRLNPRDLADDFLNQLYSFFFPEEDFERLLQDTDSEGIAKWTGLPAGEYRVSENDAPEDWILTTKRRQTVQLNPGVKETEEVLFGNRRPALIVYKYDNDTGDVVPGWEICLYEAVFDEDKERYVSVALVEPCKKTLDDSNEEDPGQFHGAAVFSSENLKPDTWYIVDEEEREGWRLENWDGYYEDIVDEDLGQILVQFEGSFFEEAEDAELSLYNRDIGGDIVVLKYLDENRGLTVRGWEVCLREFDEETGEAGAVIGECKETDESGRVQWQNVLPGTYILDEEEREIWGWQQQGFRTSESNNAELQEFGPAGTGQVQVSLDENGYAEIHFLNWVNDPILPPQSAFEDPMEHKVIDTEIVSLELRGGSVDNPNPPIVEVDEEGKEIITMGPSGIHDATLTVRQLAGPEAVADYPSRSFFDVFHAIDCRDLPEEIPIEIVSLSLVSADPITVRWDTEVDLGRRGPGIYCFEVRATDNAGNSERTGYAGPLAYVPTPKISEESTNEVEETSFTVNWTTAHEATSRVIYDTVSHPDEELGDAPNYGYAFSTEETDLDPNKVTEHSVTVSGLTSGTTYYYRSVSVGSPVAVGSQGSITTSSPPPPPASSGGGGGGGGGGTIFGPGEGGPPEPIVSPPTEPQGEVLGAATSIEEQIAALRAKIAGLRLKLIDLIRKRIGELQAELAALIASQ